MDIKLLLYILDTIPFGLFCKDYGDGSGRYIAWNAMNASISGYDKDFAIGKTDYDYFTKEQADIFRERDLKVLKSQKCLFIPEQNVGKTGQENHFLRMWKFPLFDRGKPRYILGVCEDITYLKQLENALALERANTLASIKYQSQVSLARQVAHEVNNPLAIIMGRAYELLRGPQKNDPFTQKIGSSIIETIKLAAEKVQGFQDLLPPQENHVVDYAKLEKSKSKQDMNGTMEPVGGSPLVRLKLESVEKILDNLPDTPEFKKIRIECEAALRSTLLV